MEMKNFKTLSEREKAENAESKGLTANLSFTALSFHISIVLFIFTFVCGHDRK